MLSLARVSTRMGQHYYSADNYYTKNREVERSEWFGAGSEELGLRGKVSADVFQSLLEGRHPITKSILTPDHDNLQAKRRAAIDLTFSAPKSVSLAALVGGDERLIKAHEEAVSIALGVCQERYSLVRTGAKEYRQIEATGNLVVAKFHHDTSRAKDPQLHTHCVALNLVKRRDGQWRSLHNDGVFTNSKLLGLVYQNELAKRSLALGYQIEVKPNGTFEIDGYTHDQLKTFSKRREQIEELGAENQRDARRLVKVQRQAKGLEVPRHELAQRWEREAKACELSHPIPRTQKQVRDVQQDMKHIINEGAKHVTERDVSFKKEALEVFTLENNLGRTNWNSLQHGVGEAEQNGFLLKTQNGQLTTISCVQIEHEMVAMLRLGQSTQAPVAQEIPRSVRENILGLTQGQKDAIELSLSSRDQIIGWQGVAGSGKTFAMKILQEESTKNKWKVRGFAPSAEAAKVLETEGRIPSQTVASLLAKPFSERNTREREIWIVDEAGLLSAKDCHALLVRSRQENARIVLVGDTRQLSSVGAGNAFKLLQNCGMKTAELNESRRQKQEVLKLAVQDIAHGKISEGLTKLDKHIHEFRREETRIQHATEQYITMPKAEREQNLVLAGTNRERDLLTERIRNALKAEHQLHSEIPMRTLRQKNLTKEEISHASKIESGDVITLQKSVPQLNLKKDVAYEVMAAHNKTLQLRTPDGSEVTFVPNKTSIGGVYEKRESQFAVGDRVRWTKNIRSFGVRNGQEATVVDQSHDSISIQSRDGKTISLNRETFAHIDHNYVNTVYSSQGKTCDNVIVCADDTFGKEAMYVAVSRAKFGVQIFCEDKEKLFSLASESRAKLSAIELINAEMVKIEKEARAELTIPQPTIETKQEKGIEQTTTQKQEVSQNQTREVEYDYSIGM